MSQDLEWKVLGYFRDVFREHADTASPDAEEVVKAIGCTEAEAEAAIHALRRKNLLVRKLTYGAYHITPQGISAWEKSRR